jgi:type VI secretion system protein VasD
MPTFYRTVRTLLIAHLVFLGACSSVPLGDGITDLTLKITVAADANPDDSGRASPVFLTVFEMRDTGTFERTRYLDLYRDPGAALGASLITTSEIGPLFPGSTRTEQLRLNASTTAVGIMGGFNRYDEMKTTVTLPLTPGDDETVQILVDGRGIAVE